MNQLEFQNWCQESEGHHVDGRGMSEHCHLDEKIVTFEHDDMSVIPKDEDAGFHKIEGPAHEFFNMGTAQLATQVDNHTIIFQR